MNEGNIVNKVAARLSLDITPAEQQLQQLTRSMATFADNASAVFNSGMTSIQQSEQELQAKLKQIDEDGNQVRLMMWAAVNNQLQLDQATANAKMERDNELHQQKMLQTDELYQEKLRQLTANGIASSGSSKTTGGFGIGVGEMAKMMIEFTGLSALYENVKKGIVDVSQSAAGLQNVFHGQITNQQQLNDVTNQFIDIAKQYGVSIDEVLQSAQLWGRQYDEQITKILTSNSTLLSVVDNVGVTDANKAVESSMQALGMSVNNASEAYANSMKLIDSWTAVSHNASVSTMDLITAFERSAAAAHDSGISVDQLNALVASAIRNTGQTGSAIGNMLKTVLTNISAASPKVQAAFQQLGISMTETGANGQKVLKPTYDLLLELGQAMEHMSTSQVGAVKAIGGSMYQVDRLEAMLRSVTATQDNYTVSTKSMGTAQEMAKAKLDTLKTDLQRLQDTIQQLAYNAGQSGGLSDMLKGLVTGITDLINGLQKLPAAADWGILGFAGLLVSAKAITSMVQTCKSAFDGIRSGIQFWSNAVQAAIPPMETFTADLNGGIIAARQQMQAEMEAAQAIEGGTTALGENTGAIESNTNALESNAIAQESAATGAEVAGPAFVTEGEDATIASEGVFTLDSALSGVTFGLTLLIPILAVVVGHMGSQTDAAQQAAQANQQLANSLQQQVQQAQSSTSTVINNITQLQELKKQYEDVKSALDHATKGSQQYQSLMAQEEGIHRQLISIVGEQAAKQILASNDIVGSINSETTALIKEQIVENQAAINKVSAEQLKTVNTYTAVMTRIGFYQQEMDKLDSLQKKAAQDSKTGQGSTNSYAHYSAVNRYNQAQQQKDAKTKQHQEDLTNAANLKKTMDSETAAINKMQDQNAQLESILKSLKDNPDYIPNVTTNDPYGGTGHTGAPPSGSSTTKKTSIKKSATAAATSYDQPFVALTKEDVQTVKDAQGGIAKLTNTVTKYKDAMTNAEKQLKANINDTKAAKQLTSDYQNAVESLKEHQSDLTRVNDKDSQMLAALKQKLDDVNTAYNHHTITLQEHDAAVKTLQGEINNLTKSINDNQRAVEADGQSIATLTQQYANDINTWNFDQAKQGVDALTASLKQMETDALANIDSQITDIDNQLSALQWNNTVENNHDKLTKLQQEAAQYKNATSSQGRKQYQDYLSQISDLQDQMNYDQKQHDLETQKSTLEQQKSQIQTYYTNLLNSFQNFSNNISSINDTLNKLIQDRAMATDKVIQGLLDSEIAKLTALKDGWLSVSSGAPSGGGITYIKGGIPVNDNPSNGVLPGRKPVAFAGGGEVPNIASGIDTVPAWLTPGEKVVPEKDFDDLMRGYNWRSVNAQPASNMVVHMDFANAFSGATFTNKSDADYAIRQLEIRLERKLESRMRAAGQRR